MKYNKFKYVNVIQEALVICEFCYSRFQLSAANELWTKLVIRWYFPRLSVYFGLFKVKKGPQYCDTLLFAVLVFSEYSSAVTPTLKHLDRPAVNLINVKRANFSYKHCFGSFCSSYIHVVKELPKQRSYKKFVRLMLMKLTPVEWN